MTPQQHAEFVERLGDILLMATNTASVDLQMVIKEKDKRIAELEARELGYIQSLRELEAENRLLRSAIQDEMEQGGFIGDSIGEVLEDIRADLEDV